MKTKTIFGREPAAWLGLIEMVLTLLMAFSFGVDQTTFGPIMAVVTAVFGVYTAWVTKDTLLGVIVGLAKSGFVLMAVYGFTFTDAQTGAVIGVITVVVGFFNRTQTSPVLENPGVPPGVTPVAPTTEPALPA